MRTAGLKKVKGQLSNFIALAQKDFVLITKHGRPSALVVGVEGHDMEDVFYMTNPRFWRSIGKRRKQKAIPWKTAKTRLY